MDYGIDTVWFPCLTAHLAFNTVGYTGVTISGKTEVSLYPALQSSVMSPTWTPNSDFNLMSTLPVHSYYLGSIKVDRNVSAFLHQVQVHPIHSHNFATHSASQLFFLTTFIFYYHQYAFLHYYRYCCHCIYCLLNCSLHSNKVCVLFFNKFLDNTTHLPL